MIDLHTHSTYSDGTLTPGELIALARDTGLEAIALCDHNTVAGLPEFLAAAREMGVNGVAGVEFSTDHQGRELHILALCLHESCFDAVTAFLEELNRRKEESNRCLIHALEAAGLDLDYEAIKASTPKGQVNRAVIAARMVEQGYVPSVEAAFAQWLSPKRGYYQPPARPDAVETIRFIASLGAAPVLAHPFLNLEEEEGLREFLKKAVPAGLLGMEVYYPLFDTEKTRLAQTIAKEFGLLESGGSDFHGANKPDIALGQGKDNLNIPMEIFQQIMENVKK